MRHQGQKLNLERRIDKTYNDPTPVQYYIDFQNGIQIDTCYSFKMGLDLLSGKWVSVKFYWKRYLRHLYIQFKYSSIIAIVRSGVVCLRLEDI